VRLFRNQLILCLFVMCLTAVFVGTASAATLERPSTTHPKAQKTVVWSCNAKAMADAKLQAAPLNIYGGAEVDIVNYNQVEVYVTGSLLRNDFVECYYKSKNGDIPNLVYKFACKKGVKGGTSYAHSYTCVQ